METKKTRFEVGQRVRVLDALPGYEPLAIYEVEAVEETTTAIFGTFVVYQLVCLPTGEVKKIKNGHLLLAEVEDEEICEHCSEYWNHGEDPYCRGCISAMKEIEEDNEQIDAARKAAVAKLTAVVEVFEPTHTVLVRFAGDGSRAVSERIYLVAAKLERRAAEGGNRWAISPRAWRGELDVECTSVAEMVAAEAQVRDVLDVVAKEVR